MSQTFLRIRSLRIKFFMRAGWLMALLCLVLTACSRQASIRVLFIGNSFTSINGGIDQQLKGLAPSIETATLAVGGYTLEKHWTDGNALQTIRQGGWTYVVLQEQSQTPIIDESNFERYAQLFDNEIRKKGAQTILLMTWTRPDSANGGVTTRNLAAVFTAVGNILGVRVAPVGQAFDNSLLQKSNLALYVQDGHPTENGTYLAACVLYGTLFKRSPVGNGYATWGMSSDLRDYFQRVAATSLGY